MKVGILGVGLLSAGLDGWMKGRAVLAGTSSYRPGRYLSPSHPCCRPTNVAAAATPSVALHVADEAVRQSGLHAQELATVFASSGGEMAVLDQLCRALTTPDRALSPTLFISRFTTPRPAIGALRPAVSNPRPRCPPMTIRPPWDY